MANNQTRRLQPSLLAADQNVVAALKSMTDYAPANPAYSLAALTAAQSDLEKARSAEVQAEAAAAAARDEAAAKEREFHNLVLGVKDQVMAQFGRDSNELQALGLKKASERKPVQRRTKAETAQK